MRSLIKVLREKCPWDQKQTPETLIVYLIEEVYELLDAITSGHPENIMDEMGDVMFQLLFISLLYEQKNLFSLRDVILMNREKMVRRHPHVFGNTTAKDAAEVKKNWNIIKSGEKDRSVTSIMDGTPSGLPALHRAFMISEKVGKAGFDWDDIHGVIAKVEEEWRELHGAIKTGEKDDIALEFGDLLFTLTNIARFLGIHPETALAASVKKFETRYRHMEQELAPLGKSLEDLSPEEKDRIWERAKKDTK
ncbi:MAG: nucleoside triphosphate pyrophosphohydrolase [Proteobacteria bacterium]|nr:nucleoside triphosphate pyrophosphohydrolase [Pseudomonadota bacterium]